MKALRPESSVLVKKRHFEAIGMWQAARGFKAQSLLAAIYRKPGSLAIKLPGFPITEKSTAPQPRQPVAKVFKPIPNSFRPPPSRRRHEEPQLSTTYIHNKKKLARKYIEPVLTCGGGQTRTDDLWVMSPTSYHCSTPRFACAKVTLFRHLSIAKTKKVRFLANI